MKHLPIGYIKEYKYHDKVIYDVSLFHNKVHEVFEDRADALELVRLHSDAFLRIGETDAICVQYINLKHQMHYLMIDTVWGPKKTPQIHEQTNFEYQTSHSLYYHNWSKRRLINERRVTSSDILRSSINFRPWYAAIHVIIAAIICVLSMMYVVDAIKYLNDEQMQSSHRQLNILLAFIMFVVTISTTGLIYLAFYISRKRILNASYDYTEINWRRWYKMRLMIALYVALISAGSLFILIFFATDYVTDNVNLVGKYFNDEPQLLVALYGLMLLFGFMFISMIGFIGFAFYNTASKAKLYFNEAQRTQFRKWILHIKYERDVVADAPKDFFILPPEVSEYPVKKEIQTSQEIRLQYAPDEYKRYKMKAIKHFRNAVNIHLKNIEEASKHHEHLSKDHQ